MSAKDSIMIELDQDIYQNLSNPQKCVCYSEKIYNDEEFLKLNCSVTEQDMSLDLSENEHMGVTHFGDNKIKTIDLYRAQRIDQSNAQNNDLYNESIQVAQALRELQGSQTQTQTNSLQSQITSISSYVVSNTFSSYTLSFWPKDVLSSNHNVEIGFPIELQLSALLIQSHQVSIFIDSVEKVQSQCAISNAYDQLTITCKNSFSSSFTNKLGGEVKIMVKYLKNPGTLNKTSSIIVSILDLNGKIIEQASKALNVQMRFLKEPTSQSLQIQPNSLVNGDVTTYKISFESQFLLLDGDFLSFYVPKEITFPNDMKCISSTEKMFTLKCIMTKDSKGVKIESYFQIPQKSIDIGKNISIEFGNILNPWSTKPTSNFQQVTLYNKVRDLIFEFKNSTNISTKDPGNVTNANLTNGEINQDFETTYVIDFQNKNKMEANFTFQVTYPENMIIEKNLIDCKVLVNGITYIYQCTVNQENNIISLTPEISVPAIVSRQNLSIIFGKIVIPINDYSDSDYGFGLHSYSDSLFQYEVDQIDKNLLNLSDRCIMPCKSCLPNNQSFCLSCYTDNPDIQQQHFYKNQCLNQCPSGLVPGENLECKECDYRCEQCSLVGDCLKCKSNYPFYLESNDTCLDQCPETYYIDQQNFCNQCLDDEILLPTGKCEKKPKESQSNLQYLFFLITLAQIVSASVLACKKKKYPLMMLTYSISAVWGIIEIISYLALIITHYTMFESNDLSQNLQISDDSVIDKLTLSLYIAALVLLFTTNMWFYIVYLDYIKVDVIFDSIKNKFPKTLKMICLVSSALTFKFSTIYYSFLSNSEKFQIQFESQKILDYHYKMLGLNLITVGFMLVSSILNLVYYYELEYLWVISIVNLLLCISILILQMIILFSIDKKETFNKKILNDTFNSPDKKIKDEEKQGMRDSVGKLIRLENKQHNQNNQIPQVFGVDDTPQDPQNNVGQESEDQIRLRKLPKIQDDSVLDEYKKEKQNEQVNPAQINIQIDLNINGQSAQIKKY
ncbi:UNKNOWN [Stylonychia lemnae]|uniref:Uncharacterized protein n=1 Tax=Stylonychia lemnae TaxID=5949 RepID=A0A077ZWC9_STYLE|nr:UNKNOWN [Stylonychia lemnae]|eukprot:CDW73575.1 UNKNOWN [Stylonychia lemnae]